MMSNITDYKDYKIIIGEDVKITNGVGTIVIDKALLEYLNYIFESEDKENEQK